MLPGLPPLIHAALLQQRPVLPVGRDARAGAAIAVNLAQILEWTREKAAAIDQITAIERGPNLLSYGLLKLHPRWD